MRTIKLRAWDDEIKHMYYPPNSHICLWSDGICENLQTGKRLIPMFWIGLLDRNGKEVWEGDIVRVSEKNPILYEIKWHDGKFRLWDFIANTFFDGMYKIKKYEKIGNIFENPNLLKGD